MTVAGALVEWSYVSFGAGCSGILIVQPVPQWCLDCHCLKFSNGGFECHWIR